MGDGVFVSYRKDDESGWAGRVNDKLVARFGEDRVFFDVDSIRGGESWQQAIDRALDQSKVLVLVIGPNWVDIMKARRTAGTDDVHLREIAMALGHGVDVYQLLVNGASMPDPADLPDDLQALAGYQWRQLHVDAYEAVMGTVLDEVQRIIEPPPEPEPEPEPEPAPAPPPTPARTTSAPGERRGRALVSVGPVGSDAEFHEIADAAAAVGPGSTIRVGKGSYAKPVLLDVPVTILADERGAAVLECAEGTCIVSTATDCTVQGLHVRTAARSTGIGIEVAAGGLVVKGCTISSRWADTATGVHVSGARTTVAVQGCELRDLAIGVHVIDGAEPRIENCAIGPTELCGVLVEHQAAPQVHGCRFQGSRGSALVFAAGGLGAVSRCQLLDSTGPGIVVKDGGDPYIRGDRGAVRTDQPAEGAPRQRRPWPLDRGGRDVRGGTTDWAIHVHDGGKGTVERCDLAVLHTESGGDPTVTGSQLALLRAEHGGLGTIEDCDVDRVVLSSGADPVVRSSKVSPRQRVKTTVEIRDDARGTFDDCEIVGRWKRDSSIDPAITVVRGADPVFRRCTVSNPGAGALVVGDGGRARIEAGELRVSMGCPALLVGDGCSVSVSGDALVHGGVRVDDGGAVAFEGGTVESDSIGASGVVVEAGGRCTMRDVKVHKVTARGVVVVGTVDLSGCEITDIGSVGLDVIKGGRLTASDCTVRGAGVSRTRKVGRWIESYTDKARGKSELVLGKAPAVAVAEGAEASFERCEVSEAGDRPVVAPSEGVRFVDCTVDGKPFPTAATVPEAPPAS